MRNLELFALVMLVILMTGTRAYAQGNDLIVASGKGDLSRVRALLDAKADVNAKDDNEETALIEASVTGHADVVRVLIDAKADVNAKDLNGETALIEASGNNRADVVHLLLDAKADVNAKDNNGRTALIVASGNYRTDVGQALLIANADINAKGSNDNTALVEASGHDLADIVRTLLDAKADINARDNNGWTALIEASAHGYVDVVRVLLDAKADVNARDNNGFTALNRATVSDHAEVVQLLRRTGAEEIKSAHSWLWIPINGWLFGVCLALVIVAGTVAFISIGVQLHKRSSTRGGLSFRFLLLGLALIIPCIMLWRWWDSALDQAARDHLVPLTLRGEADPNLFGAVGGLFFYPFTILSAFAVLCIVYGGIGMLTSSVGRSSGRTTVTTSFHCPHCKAVIKPFHFPLRGLGTCRSCGRAFSIPEVGSLHDAIRSDLARKFKRRS